jgi:hypothetical protein
MAVGAAGSGFSRNRLKLRNDLAGVLFHFLTESQI